MLAASGIFNNSTATSDGSCHVVTSLLSPRTAILSGSCLYPVTLPYAVYPTADAGDPQTPNRRDFSRDVEAVNLRALSVHLQQNHKHHQVCPHVGVRILQVPIQSKLPVRVALATPSQYLSPWCVPGACSDLFTPMSSRARHNATMATTTNFVAAEMAVPPCDMPAMTWHQGD